MVGEEAVSWGALPAQMLFRVLPEPALIVAVDGQVLAANDCAVELFELDRQSSLTSVTELLTQPERERLQVLSWLSKWADTPDAPELDYVYLDVRTPSRGERQMSVRVARLRLEATPEREAMTCYLVSMHDISPWQQRIRREREAHRVAARILAISADAVLVVNEQMHITFANPSAEKLFGYAAGELDGLPLAQLLPDRYRQQHESFVRRFGEDRVPAKYMGDRAAVSGLTKQGTEIALDASIAKVRQPQGLLFTVQLRTQPTGGAKGDHPAHA